MARTREVDGIQTVALDHPIGMGPDEGLTGARAPVSEQAVFDVLGLQWFPQQRVVLEIDHSNRQVVGGPPPGVEPLKLTGYQGMGGIAGHGFRCLCLRGK